MNDWSRDIFVVITGSGLYPVLEHVNMNGFFFNIIQIMWHIKQNATEMDIQF